MLDCMSDCGPLTKAMSLEYFMSDYGPKQRRCHYPRVHTDARLYDTQTHIEALARIQAHTPPDPNVRPCVMWQQDDVVTARTEVVFSFV
jgi:hypothetical protein